LFRMIILNLSNNSKAEDVIMDKYISKISAEWLREIRKIFIRFFGETGFSNSGRLGERGYISRYPE